jgi:endonuclease YncB( thermonuclease family)
LGVDTPEIHTAVDPPEWEGIPDTTAGRDHLRDWGEQASTFAKNQLDVGEQIRLVVDAEADRRGAYGRLLVYIYDDGALFNLLLIEQGYARYYESTFTKSGQFEDTESSARSNDVGVWDFEAPTPTATPTPTQTETQSEAKLAVVEIHEDAEGNDHENENDEYIVFDNTGDSTLDLTGWTVKDEADHTYTFPSGFTLGPGDRVMLHTGSGSDTSTDLYWGSDAAIWNNGGDTIYVKDDSGNTVIERSYS